MGCDISLRGSRAPVFLGNKMLNLPVTCTLMYYLLVELLKKINAKTWLHLVVDFSQAVGGRLPVIMNLSPTLTLFCSTVRKFSNVCWPILQTLLQSLVLPAYLNLSKLKYYFWICDKWILSNLKLQCAP